MEFDDDADPFAEEFAPIDAVLARSQAVIEQAKTPGLAPAKGALVCDLDWDEEERLEEWRGILRQAGNLPAMPPQTIVALDARNELSVLRAPWLGRLLAASILRQAGIPGASRHLSISA